jgi:hypothetical protein
MVRETYWITGRSSSARPSRNVPVALVRIAAKFRDERHDSSALFGVIPVRDPQLEQTGEQRVAFLAAQTPTS